MCGGRTRGFVYFRFSCRCVFLVQGESSIFDGKSHIMASKDTPSVISEGDQVVIKRDKVMKVVQLRKGRFVADILGDNTCSLYTTVR